MLNRRDMLKGGVIAAGAAGAAALGTPAAAQKRDWALPTGAESAKLFLPDDGLAPATYDRLPLSWNKERVRLLQQKLGAAGYDGIILTDRWNVIYFTGFWHTSTERMINCFIPTTGTHPIWFTPTLDRDMVHTWWYEEGETYFDFPDVAGSMPYEGIVTKGVTRDMWRWLLEGVAKRGFVGKSVAVDYELPPSRQKAVVDVLKKPAGDAGMICMDMRMRKTPEELALTRRAYRYFDQMHAFARDLIQAHGTDLYDYDIKNLTEKFGTDLIMRDIKHDGRPHSAVGIDIGIEVRVGTPNGFPHPNQFYYGKIERGKTIQVAGVVKIGGCGGELYRPYQIAPRTDLMEKLWRVNRDGCLMQKDLSRKGVECSEVAYKILSFQVAQGVQKYIRHRPAHGEGMEGHQPPYLSLGDHTILDTGMCFSVEPGLFDPDTGVGANSSDHFVIQPTGPALQMSRLPWSEEWGFISI